MIVNGFLIVEHLRLSDFGSAMYSVHNAGMSCHRVAQSGAASIMLLCHSRTLVRQMIVNVFQSGEQIIHRDLSPDGANSLWWTSDN